MRQVWESRRIRDEDSVQHVMSDPCQALVTTAGIVSTSSSVAWDHGSHSFTAVVFLQAQEKLCISSDCL